MGKQKARHTIPSTVAAVRNSLKGQYGLRGQHELLELYRSKPLDYHDDDTINMLHNAVMRSALVWEDTINPLTGETISYASYFKADGYVFRKEYVELVQAFLSEKKFIELDVTDSEGQPIKCFIAKRIRNNGKPEYRLTVDASYCDELQGVDVFVQAGKRARVVARRLHSWQKMQEDFEWDRACEKKEDKRGYKLFEFIGEGHDKSLSLYERDARDFINTLEDAYEGIPGARAVFSWDMVGYLTNVVEYLTGVDEPVRRDVSPALLKATLMSVPAGPVVQDVAINQPLDNDSEFIDDAKTRLVDAIVADAKRIYGQQTVYIGAATFTVVGHHLPSSSDGDLDSASVIIYTMRGPGLPGVVQKTYRPGRILASDARMHYKAACGADGFEIPEEGTVDIGLPGNARLIGYEYETLGNGLASRSACVYNEAENSRVVVEMSLAPGVPEDAKATADVIKEITVSSPVTEQSAEADVPVSTDGVDIPDNDETTTED